MKHIILFIAAILSCLTGFAQGGYDPENPGDPSPYRKLTVYASPKSGGSVSPAGNQQVGVGQTVSCHADANAYYDFVHWLKNGEIVSSEQDFTFVMPDENVEMLAVFEFNYNPQSPDDPQDPGLTHRVTLTASPGKGGRFNKSVFKLAEGESVNVYAYPNEGYRFEEWLLNGVLVSTKNPLNITMTDKDLHFTARFSYNPVNPSDPGANLFNPGTGEMIIDRFEPGYLSSAISQLLNDNYDYSEVQSLKICGMMDCSDFGVISRMSNCSVIDLSRTNGYTEIPGYAFESITSLTDVLLPSCVQTIGEFAFADCVNLSVMTCYAVIPPVLDDDAFHGIDRSLIVKVSAQSIDLYKNAQGWKDFTILPADSEVYSIFVSLPDDAKDGRYKNMSIELLNITNGQRYKYLITDKTEYVFGNLLSSTKYCVDVRNSKNEVLGEISDLEIFDKDLTAKFQNLRQPQNITIKVMTPEEIDVTSEVIVKWFNDSNEFLQQGSSLSGVLDNTVVSYIVELPSELQRSYEQPTSQSITVSSQNLLTCTLHELGKSILKGKVCDVDGKAINTAIIAISQNLNGQYTNSTVVHCDDNGSYEIETPDVPLKVSVSANGYVEQTMNLQSASMGIGDIVLEKITGITIYPSVTFQESVLAGQEVSTSDWLNEGGDITFRIVDLEGNEIANCIYQSGSIVLPDNIMQDDEISLVAYSKSNRFHEISQSVVLNSRKVYVNMSIVEYGGIRITANEEDVLTGTCLLYNESGIQVGRTTFRDNNVTIENLPDGQYTLISVQKSQLLGSVTNLSSFQEIQLVQGSDYLLDKIDVVSGQISDVSIAKIPVLDETKLYYTDSKETYFMPNKSQLTIGNYLTLKAKLTIKDEYADVIDAATLIVDIPSNCELVGNSIISGSGYLGYEYADNRLSIPMQNLCDAVRFCIVPLEGGECKPSAFVKLIIDNEEVLQPIGSAYFEAKNFSLATPQKTSKTNIVVCGTAISDSEVLIYDNGFLVGSTYSISNGQWFSNIELHKPYSKSLHNIYGEVINKDGKRLMTQSKVVDYDQSYIDLSKVTMLYCNNAIVFDHINSRNTTNYYSYVPGKTDFTFTVDFTENNPERISNVIVKVLLSDGNLRFLPAEYNTASGNYVAKTKFTDSKRLPVNVTATYDINDEGKVYCEERYINQQNTLNKIVDTYWDNVGESDIEIITESSDFVEALLTRDDGLTCNVAVRQLSLDDSRLNVDEAYLCNIDNESYWIICSEQGPGESLIVWSDKDAFELSLMASSTHDRSISKAPFHFDFWQFLRRILGIDDLYHYIEDYNYWEQVYDRTVSNHIELDRHIHRLLLAKCPDDSYKLYTSNLRHYASLAESYRNDASMMEESLRQKIDLYSTQIRSLCGLHATIGAASAMLGAVSSLVSESIRLTFANLFTRNFVRELGENLVENQLTNFAQSILDELNGARSTSEYLWSRHFPEEMQLIKRYNSLGITIQGSYRNCPKDDDEDPDDDEPKDNHPDDNGFPLPPVSPSIDPSGYVYEAVPSNRISGVTATAYYQKREEDIYGDITETPTLWDAKQFGQENPLITDADGRYAWDVPAGMWQVRFDKEGYEPAQSAWLPVPPPQLDVNIAMTQVKQPEVIGVHAYQDGVVIEFDKFMLPSSLSFGNIMVTQNGKVVNGEIHAVKAENDTEGNPLYSKIEYKPSEPFAEGNATLFVSKAVKSYANIHMSEDFMQEFAVEPRISEIKVNKNVEVNSGSSMKMFAWILPAEAAQGKTILIESLNSMIASVTPSSVVTDANGMVQFEISGLIQGSTDIKLSVEGYDVDALVKVEVLSPLDANQVAAPYASIEAGPVSVGTEVYLFCETEDASIYYTLDGSCPCDAGRLKYEGTPIIINRDLTLKVMAEAEGKVESDVVEYNYYVTTTGIDLTAAENALSVYPLPMGDFINITNNGNVIESVSIFNINGNLMVNSDKSAQFVTLKVGHLAPGVYILNVNSNGSSIVKKVIKR